VNLRVDLMFVGCSERKSGGFEAVHRFYGGVIPAPPVTSKRCALSSTLVEDSLTTTGGSHERHIGDLCAYLLNAPLHVW